MRSRIRNLAIAMIVFAVVGLVDATYLTWQHYAHKIPPCTIHGCETVLSSSYAQIGPFPVSIFGAGYYLVVLILLAMFVEGVVKTRPWIMAIISAGVAFTLYLTYVQGFVIHAWCQYCLLSAGTTATLFILSFFLRSHDQQPAMPSQPAHV